MTCVLELWPICASAVATVSRTMTLAPPGPQGHVESLLLKIAFGLGLKEPAMLGFGGTQSSWTVTAVSVFFRSLFFPAVPSRRSLRG